MRMDTNCKPLDLPRLGTLSFFEPDEDRFPATKLAREAAEAGGAAPAVLNAANEVAVAAFLKGQLAFTQISAIAARILEQELPSAPATMEEVLAVDAEARQRAVEMLETV
jgi:1-deoxy-D-xylulose-5-phosphate reductoisomerase